MIGPEEERLLDAFADCAQQGVGVVSEQQLDAGWQRLQSPATDPIPSRDPRPRRPSHFWLAGLATAGALALLAVIGYRLIPENQGAPLQYSVEGTATTNARTITGAPSGQSSLRFSDDSRIQLGAQARLTVEALDAKGAQIALVNGSIDVYVKPRSGAAWAFTAGPFRVKVKGTSFRLGYSDQLRRMSLHMTSGLVEVSGSRGRTISVAAGESIELFAEPTLAEVSPDKTTQADVPSEAPKTDTSLATAGRAPSLAARPVAGAEPSRRRPAVRAKDEREAAAEPAAAPWARLITEGRFAAVVDEAEQRGLDSTLNHASPAELSALADAARYTKRTDLARRVLLALRARFAGTEPARDASFFLGRLGEASPGQSRDAMVWYETYLAEAPRGLYASEALGREMTLLAPTARARAGKLARQYLERFPHGSQAELARSLLETGSE